MYIKHHLELSNYERNDNCHKNDKSENDLSFDTRISIRKIKGIREDVYYQKHSKCHKLVNNTQTL